MSELVSIIIPTYYRNNRLQDAITSSKNQTHDNIEIIVVDGTGEDNARPVVDDTDCRYIGQDTDNGPHAARSDGAAASNGKYVQFLDDDDWLHPEKLEKQLSLLNKSDAGVVFCGRKTESGYRQLPPDTLRGNVLFEMLCFRGEPCLTSTMLISRTLIDEIHPLPNQHAADDIGMRIELAKRTQFDYVDEVLVTAGEPEYTLGTTWASVEARWRVLDTYEELYRKHPQAERSAKAETYQHAGRRLIEDNVWSLRAIYCFAQAIRYTPDITETYLAEFVTALGGRPLRNTAKRLKYRLHRRDNSSR